jgi:hypothetical protein
MRSKQRPDFKEPAFVSMTLTRMLDRLARNAASNAIGCAKFYSRSHDAVIRVYDDAGKVIETQQRAGPPWLAKENWKNRVQLPC